jgi:hypothetical protein
MALIGGICLLAGFILLNIYRWEDDKIFFPMLLFILGMAIYFFGLVEILPEKIPGIEKPELIGVVVGFLVMHAFGPLIPILKEYIKLERHTSIDEETWKILMRYDSSKLGGVCIGYIERTLYFIAFFWNPLYIGGLLTFKVLAKWEAWKNIVKVPGECKFTNNFDFFLFRFKWGGYFMTTFIIGTFSNILFAAIGYGFYGWVLKVLDP